MSDCVEWTGALDKDGYGTKGGKSNRRVHRLTWAQANGPIPDSMCILHTCDNRACINLNHLYVGTRADNFKDCVSRDRHIRGERSHLAKLTDDDVVAIRARHRDGETTASLAREYRVCQQNIRSIVKRRIWKHIK